MILAEFDECMRPDEVKFDRLNIWARILNLPYHMRNDTWGPSIAAQIDKEATMVHFDHVGGFLRARVSIEVVKPLRRWILINSARRKKVDPYDIQYEQLPYFCFSCGRLGHSDLHCPTPGSRDERGNLQWGANLRAPEEYKKPATSENSSKEQGSKTSSHRESKNSSSHGGVGPGAEVNSPTKRSQQQKRKGVPQEQVYRPVVNKPLMLTLGDDAGNTGQADMDKLAAEKGMTDEDDLGTERDPKKKKPTPENSAEAAGQPCLSQ